MYFIEKLKHYWVSSNNLKYLSVGLLTSVANLFLSGSILQSFMLKNGISEKNVAFFMSALQIVQVSVMLCMSPVVDRIKRIIKVNASVNLSVAVYALLLAAISVLSGFSPDVKYSMVLIGGIAVNVFSGCK